MLDQKEAAISRGVLSPLGDKCGSVLEGVCCLVNYVVGKIIEYSRLPNS